MANNLTGSKIRDSYNQLLHVDGGPTASEKVVNSGTGVATALKLGTGSASVDNLRLDGNTISATNTNGDITLTPNGTGSVVLGKVAITSGTISGITPLALADGGTGASTASGARSALNLGSMATQAAGNVAITGGAISNVTLTNVTLPFASLTGRAYASFYDAGTTDQVGSTIDRTAVKFATAAVAGAGITVVSDSRLTFAAAGTYRVNASLQFNNTDNTVRTVMLWYAKNGTAIANSGAKLTIPKSSEGGTFLMAYEIFEAVAAGDYIELYWLPSGLSATLHYIAPVVANPGVTPAVPAIPPAIVVAERIA